MSQYRAVRVTKGSKKIVEIRDESGAVVEKAGGNRAARANAVVVSTWTRRAGADVMEIELRADVDAAHALAALYLKKRILGYSNGEPVYRTCAAAAEVLLIEEAV